MRSILRICRSADPYLPVPIRSISARHHEGRCKEARATLQCKPPPPLAHSLACVDSRVPRFARATWQLFFRAVSQSVFLSYFTVPPRARSAETEPFKTPGGPRDPLGGWDKQSISARDVHGRLFPVREHQYTSRFSWTRACNRCVSFPQSWLPKLESRYFWMKFGSVASMYARSLARISKRNHGVR